MCLNGVKMTFGAFLAVIAILTAVPAARAEDEALFQSVATYQAQARRDPFIQSQAGLLHNVMTRLDIDVLRLTGVIVHPHRALALFSTQTGPKFGYLLKDGKLYGENHQLIVGVTGRVVSREQVVLKQGNKRIVFRMK